jgi:hypothetical protein
MTFLTGGSERLRIDTSGNVGIGTSSPNFKLDVETAGAGSLSLYNTSATSNDSHQTEIIAYGTYWNQLSNNSSSFVWKTYNAERMRMDSNGNLGIGTSSPSSKLHVNGTGFVATIIQGNSTDEVSVRFSSGTRASVNNTSNTPLDLRTNDTTRATITAGGNLLVGTATNNASGGVIQISNGITFPATQSASSDANTLDDYEEGTWTPTLTGFSGTGLTADATYTKIGRVVYCAVTITPSSGNVTGSSMQITQPFSGTKYGTGTWISGGGGQSGGIQAVPFGNTAVLSGSLSATNIVNLGWFIFT